MILIYQSSDGQRFDLKSSGLKTRTADFHDYTWLPQIREQQYGARVYRFDKEAVYYNAMISVRGSIEDRKITLNRLHEAFDKDIFSMTPGRIIHGDYYIQCYITFSSTGYTNPYTENEINIFCPYPFWIKENTYEFLKHEDVPGANEFLDFEYDFEYDYMSGTSGQGKITNQGAGPAHYRLILYGAANNPYINIDGVTIGVNTSIRSDEYVVIDSRDHTVYRYASNGSSTNIYNNRTKSQSIFEKIAAGAHTVVWPGTFGFDLTILEERSEPKWS